jgi:hypothetical protein
MLMVAIAHDLNVIEIPVRLRRRAGVSKGASQSVWKGLGVGLAMIWHIITFRLPDGATAAPARAEAGAPVESAGARAVR